MVTKMYFVAGIALILATTSLTLALDEEASNSSDLTNESNSSSIVKRSTSNRYPLVEREFVRCIRNHKTGEYLYAANLKLARDSHRRRVFTWTWGTLPEDAQWLMKTHGDEFHIKNIGYDEYMYAPQRSLVFYRYLLTWIRDSQDDFQPDDQKYGWILEPYNGNVNSGLTLIKNQYFGEYLATRDDHLHDNDRRYVIFTKDYNDESFHAVWEIQKCAFIDYAKD